jgi:hypothetical protein
MSERQGAGAEVCHQALGPVSLPLIVCVCVWLFVYLLCACDGSRMYKVCGVRRVCANACPACCCCCWALLSALCWPGCCRSDGDCWHAGMSLMMHGMRVSQM